METVDTLYQEMKMLQLKLETKCVEFIKANIGDRLILKDTFSEYVEGVVPLTFDQVSDRIMAVINGDELKIEFEDYGIYKLSTQTTDTYYCLANVVEYIINNRQYEQL